MVPSELPWAVLKNWDLAAFGSVLKVQLLPGYEKRKGELFSVPFPCPSLQQCNVVERVNWNGHEIGGVVVSQNDGENANASDGADVNDEVNANGNWNANGANGANANDCGNVIVAGDGDMP